MQELAKTATAPAESGAFASENGSVGAVTKRGEESSSSESDFDEDKVSPLWRHSFVSIWLIVNAIFLGW